MAKRYCMPDPTAALTDEILLQQVLRPQFVLEEMLRVARRGLVVVPNFGDWQVRFQVLWQGRAPITESLPYEWCNSPNIHFMTLRDFRGLCEQQNINIIREVPIIKRRAVPDAWGANLRAESALYVLERLSV